jgi:diadenylate cyclase
MDALKKLGDLIQTYFFDSFADTIKNIQIKDIVDILLLALVLFFIYKIVRDNRAGKLIIGLVTLLFISLLASIFEMHALNFLLKNFTQIGVVVVLILFQPEFRSALEKVGEAPMAGIKNIVAETNNLASVNAEIDAICTAVSDLARDKTGALIVIERSTKLGDYIKSGVLVDAAISPHILKNLFFNKAPLHDGAVIIRDGRVCAAGCFLPLSTKIDINKDLGTRHRAAIGLTELSDAIVIVVSEETGMISISKEGNLERNFSYSSLKQELNSLLIDKTVAEHVKAKTNTDNTEN